MRVRVRVRGRFGVRGRVRVRAKARRALEVLQPRFRAARRDVPVVVEGVPIVRQA